MTMSIRDKIFQRLNEANEGHHEFTAHYTLKHDPKTLHYKVMTVDKKHSKEEAENLVKKHVSSNKDVVLHSYGITHKHVKKNDSPLDGNFAKYKVNVHYQHPDKPKTVNATVHVDHADSEKHAVEQAKAHIKKSVPGAQINDKLTQFMGSGK